MSIARLPHLKYLKITTPVHVIWPPSDSELKRVCDSWTRELGSSNLCKIIVDCSYGAEENEIGEFDNVGDDIEHGLWWKGLYASYVCLLLVWVKEEKEGKWVSGGSGQSDHEMEMVKMGLEEHRFFEEGSETTGWLLIDEYQYSLEVWRRMKERQNRRLGNPFLWM